MSIPARLVLATNDLNALARVEAAAGGPVIRTEPLGFSASLAGADLLILDLDEGGTEALAELTEARASGPLPPVIGFLSHVDRPLGRAAREAGCRAISRGKFWAKLPELLSDPLS